MAITRSASRTAVIHLTALVVTLLLLGAACGGDDTTDTSTGESSNGELATLSGGSEQAEGGSDDSGSDDSGSDDGGSDDGGSDDSDSGDGDGQPTEADSELVLAEYEACLADLGITIFSPGEGVPVPGDEPDDQSPAQLTPEDFEEAEAQCDHILSDAFGDFEPSPEQEAEAADFMLALEVCMEETGVAMEVDPSGFMNPGPGVDFEEFDSAFASCIKQTEVSLEEG